MPLHNAKDSLPVVIKSILDQTFNDFTLIVLDDCSSDGSYQIVENYSQGDDRIKCFRSDVRLGLSKTWREVARIALEEFSSTHIAWVADHDLLANTWLEGLVNAFVMNPTAVLTYPKTLHVNHLDFEVEPVNHGPDLDTRYMSTKQRLMTLAMEDSFAGDMIYGLFRADILRTENIFPTEILPDRLLVQSVSIHGDAIYEPSTTRYRKVDANSPSYSKPLLKQLATLFNSENKPRYPYLSHSFYFLRQIVNKGVVEDSEIVGTRRLFLGLIHLHRSVNAYKSELEREVHSARSDNDFPEGYLDIIESGVRNEWGFLFGNFGTLMLKRYADLQEKYIAALKEAKQLKAMQIEYPQVVTDQMKNSTLLGDIIICTYNREKFLAICLDALLPQIDPVSDQVGLIVVNNNSTDETDQLLADYIKTYSWIRVVHESKQGLSHARNCGAAHSKADYLCYLDDDGKPGPDYVNTLIDVLDRERPDFLGGPVYPYYLSSKPKWFADAIEIRRYSNYSGYCDCSISGGNFVIRAGLLQDLGRFSPNYGMVGNKVRLGEERALLEAYRSNTPAKQRRIYYSLDLFILHYVPPEKMTFKYLVKRGYNSGKSSVVVKQESFLKFPGLIKKLIKQLIKLIKLGLTKPRTEEFASNLRVMAVLFGKSVQHFKHVIGIKTL